MSRGDVVRVDLPPPKGPPGREQFGQRPAIVVQSDGTASNLSTVIVVPLTSNNEALRFSGSFKLTPSPQNGLDMPSIALTCQIRAIDKKRIISKIGTLNGQELSELDRNLGDVLGI